MSMLAFFPWYHTEESFQAGEYHFLRYVREEEPVGSATKLQKQLDGVRRPYRVTRAEPIGHATLVQIDGKELTTDLSEDEVSGLFVLAELLAFAGLASREFFHWNYWNRDNFHLVVQAFRSPVRGVAVSSRRRDGQATSYLTGGSYRVFLPSHVHLPVRMELDVDLLTALLAARDSSLWPQLLEGITNFNLANTDSDVVRPEVEAVLMIGAFERVLDCTRGREEELAERLESSFSPAVPLTPRDCSRESTNRRVTEDFSKRGSVRDGWIRDFFRLRGNLAHGRIQPKYSSIWSLHEHLLLGAYLLPLLVKQVLAREGYLSVTPGLLASLDVFEQLACESPFAPLPDRASNAEHPWRKIQRDGRFGAEVRRFLTRFPDPAPLKNTIDSPAE
jgi:hypothetical protein